MNILETRIDILLNMDGNMMNIYDNINSYKLQEFLIWNDPRDLEKLQIREDRKLLLEMIYSSQFLNSQAVIRPKLEIRPTNYMRRPKNKP